MLRGPSTFLSSVLILTTSPAFLNFAYSIAALFRSARATLAFAFAPYLLLLVLNQSSMAADFGIGTAANVAAANVAGPIIDVVIQKLKDIIEMGENVRHLKTDFTNMEGVLVHIQNQFREQQRALPGPVHNCLERMQSALQEVDDLIVGAEPQPRCLGCCSLRNPKLSTQIRVWKTRFDGLFQELERQFSICAKTTQIVSAAASQAEVLLQPIPHSGFVGSTIQSAQMEVQAWLSEAHPQARMVGIYGMGGVGKTSLLKLVYNHFKEERGKGIFDAVIWLTISQKYDFKNLQASIAETLDLKLEGISDNDLRKMKLSESLGKKKFLLILDDLWCPIDLTEVGVTFGDHNSSKVLMSSRSSDVTGEMGASDNYSLRIQPLSIEEGWLLFRREAFTNGVLPRENNIEGIAREIASECRGLPLALNVVAAAMRLKKTEDEWKRALYLMRKVDPSFRTRHSSIDADLYQRLKWSYDQLADGNLKICFLHCAAFPEDAEIDVETLVQMCSAERLVTDLDAGQEYLDALVGRCLFEYVGDDRQEVKVHDILHDLAIIIGRSEEQWLFATGQHVQEFPSEDEIGNCKRIWVGHNDIRVLPTRLACPKLVSLVLANNTEIREVKERFFSAAMSLKVLDLSYTEITTLPTSLGQLGQLEFLNLSGCSSLENLPEDTGNLSRLRFLHLEECKSLKSLPDSIRNLRNLKHLSLEGCRSLMEIPHGISHLTSLNKLTLPLWRKECAVSVEDIANLSNLMELGATVKSEIKESTMTTWTDLRRLEIDCVYDADIDDVLEEHDVVEEHDADSDDVVAQHDGHGDDVVEDHIFPVYMDNLKKLEHFHLWHYEGVSLPICISQFQNLRSLVLRKCPELRELPACQIGNATVVGGFPMLKSLHLFRLEKLESMMVGSSVLSSEETMPQLEHIFISECSSLKRLTTKKLSSLKKLDIRCCEEFEALEIESGGLPVLQELYLNGLDKFETLVGPSCVINDGVIPKLQHLVIGVCPLLRRLSLDKLPYLRRIEIESGGLPVLQELYLHGLPVLQELYLHGPSWVINDGVMPKLQHLVIRVCPLLRRLSLDKLPYLRRITIAECSEVRELDVGTGGFPMLECLELEDCEKLENIVGPHDVSAEETMPKLQSLEIEGCPLLRRWPRGMDKLLRDRSVSIVAERNG